MHLAASILGRTAVHDLQLRNSTPVLVIGRDQFTRADLARVQCYNFTAAVALTRVLAHDIRTRVTSVSQLFNDVPPEALVVKRVGVITLAVLGAAFELAKVGGSAPLQNWVRRHRQPDAPDTFVTFDTMKRHEAAIGTGRGSTARRHRDVAAHRAALITQRRR